MKILNTLILFILISCSQNAKEKKEPVVKTQDAIKEVVESSTVEEENVVGNTAAIVEDISGVYELIQGENHMIGSENFEMYKAAIVIDKLSETDFGFYSAYKVKDISPIGDFGIFRSFKNNFYKLAICDEKEVEGYTKDNFTNGLYIYNQIFIHKKGDTLGIVRYGGNFRHYMLYKKKKNESKFYVSLVKTIKNAKQNYQEYLKEYEKAKNYDTSKLQIKHDFDGDIWKTKHIHDEDYARFESTHSYQNPYQEGKFIQQDAIFKNLFENSSFQGIINTIKTKSIPLVDTTNFDDFIEEEDYKKVDEKGLKLEEIYPNFYKEDHNYRAIASYRLAFSQKFHTVVITVLKGDHEMESVLVNYNMNGDIIDSKVIAYDEIAEGQSRIESKIEQGKLTINNILWIDEKQETTEAFKIDEKGKIKPVSVNSSEDLNLIDNVIQQLGVNKLKIQEDFIIAKVQPNNSNETIVVIPEIVGEYDEHHFELNSHIVLVNNTTGKITHKYFESSKTNGWESDAIKLSEITIDTAPYMVTKDTRAFGIRVSHYGRSRPNPYSNTTITLFVKSGNALNRVLRHYDVKDYGGEWDTRCAGVSTMVENTLMMSEEKTNAYFDIIVKSKITESKTFVDENEECDEENKTSSKTTVLKFNGKEYLKTNT
ncbi:hypothetical protein [Aquimarina sp. 2201CG14-23]|uniref:hypothetical protein n=1 Tax=Aquimarina mycalae TaxID=3040073 RepID=UPI002477F3FE|nr:hypothetical protein [Aquimarina sp. 2201CG14-23]MDH7447579.1 hypothetical protein [Aquimarina sp. 2201CG14-23]